MDNTTTTQKPVTAFATIAVTQIFSVAVMFIAAILPFSTLKASMLVCALILLVFFTLWPLKGGKSDRTIAFVAGISSLWCAALSLRGLLPNSVIDNNDSVSMSQFIAAMKPYEKWAVSFALILVAATFVSFARQMLREKRTNLVRNISHTLTASVATAALPGWLFLPSIIRFMPSLRNVYGGCAVAVICISLIIVFSGMAHLWNKNAQYDAKCIKPEIGMALLPVMLSGMLIYAAGLGMLLVA
ncbi:beta-carotene 15,15'-monooxygenase [Gardnerella vaginalis]|uniref:Beta-carotene 15,15'-monooxygenase n=1 Tax=Gardnerella vaginalis TaxID=2702 RepID=A0A2K1SVH5_GARVA|nr:beta-carotene 15,15'-monooxygenase [Gardnerella vaginalis]PNS43529.1 beta-carotene 15,15'-monooxygenase [Gardnerella vaginalis]